jgi:hypothetical protein
VTTLGAKEKATVVDFRDPLNAGVAAVFPDSPDLARQLIPDRVHPGPAGHLVMGATLLRAWNAPALVSRVEIDAAGARVVAAERSEVSGLGASFGGLSWTQLDEALPLPLSFDDATVDLAQKAGADLESLDRQVLAVSGLAASRYELKVDGQAVGTFSEAELARGVNLARFNTPMRWQAYSVAWGAGDSHELQRQRRRLLVAAEKDPALAATALALLAQDEAGQKARSEEAQPKPRRIELVPAR